MTAYQPITSVPTKRCPKCGEIKSLSDFSFINHKPPRKPRHAAYCKPCHVSIVVAYKRAKAEVRRQACRVPLTGFHPDTQILDDAGRDWAWMFVIFWPISGFIGYMAGSDGSVWSRWNGNGSGFRDEWKKMKLTSTRGYLNVGLRRCGKSVFKRVHRLILEVFRGPCPEGCESRHVVFKDTRDNRLLNLQWGTKLENSNDRRRHGTMMIGSRNPHAKLTEDDIPTIRALVLSGIPRAKVARHYHVSKFSVQCIMNGKTWKHVVDNLPVYRPPAGPPPPKGG